MIQKRIVSFANSAIVIEFEGERAARLVDFLFRDTSGDAASVPHRTFRLIVNKQRDELALFVDETQVISGESDATVADLLLGQVSFQLADTSCGGLVFHAAALGWHGQTILVPGGIGAGKTTFAAWLASKGLDYLTDELVFVPNGTEMVHAMPRPLSLKDRHIAQAFIDFDKNPGAILSRPAGDLIAVRVFGKKNSPPPERIGLIFFPHYNSDSVGEFARLSTAQTAFQLMECLINARNLEEHGMLEVARLARLVPAYRLTYSHLVQIEKPLDDLLVRIDSAGPS